MLARGSSPLPPMSLGRQRVGVRCRHGQKRFLSNSRNGGTSYRPPPAIHFSLTSNEETRDAASGIKSMAAVANSGSPTASTEGIGSFEKLKAQKLKVLAKKASVVKQKIKEHEDELVIGNAFFDKSVVSDSKLESKEKKPHVHAVRHKQKRPIATQTQDFADPLVSGKGEDMKSSNVNVEHDSYQMSDYRILPDKPKNLDPKRAVSKTSGLRNSDSLSRGWGNGGSVRSLKSKSTDPRLQRHQVPAKNDFFSRKSFRDMGCSEFMIESLEGQLFLRPSHIQAMAFAPVIEGKSCVIADQSGSGKTLAYLIPVIQRLRQEELDRLNESSSKSPQIVVMVPTTELASQVLNICRSMSKFGVPFRSMVATGGFRQRTQLENLGQGVDVLISTPGRFMFLIKEGFLKLTNLRCAVLDEVDILFNDADFEVALQSLISCSPVSAQYLFVTATLPVHIYNKLMEVFPDCEVIMGPGMHRISSKLEEILVDCSGEDGMEKNPDTAFLNKKSALLQLVEKNSVSKTIVFCNKIETCRKVENILKRFDRKGTRVRVLPFHAALAQESRLANMKEFLNSQSDEDSLYLVCTDRASRGIDFVGVDHVILFDFPRDPSEYVRRVGRTARGAGGRGKAFIFVVGKQVSLARKIIERNQKGHPLHDVPAAYELMR